MTAEEGWQQELENERHALTVAALNRCAKAGAKKEDLMTLAKECGVDPKFIAIGEKHATNQ